MKKNVFIGVQKKGEIPAACVLLTLADFRTLRKNRNNLDSSDFSRSPLAGPFNAVINEAGISSFGRKIILPYPVKIFGGYIQAPPMWDMDIEEIWEFSMNAPKSYGDVTIF